MAIEKHKITLELTIMIERGLEKHLDKNVDDPEVRLLEALRNKPELLKDFMTFQFLDLFDAEGKKLITKAIEPKKEDYDIIYEILPELNPEDSEHFQELLDTNTFFENTEGLQESFKLRLDSAKIEKA